MSTALTKALLVIVQTRGTREYLQSNDPKAYHQARRALVTNGTASDRLAPCTCSYCKDGDAECFECGGMFVSGTGHPTIALCRDCWQPR